MNWLTNFIVVIQILAGLAIVGLVLVQHGKGADMGASFGSGASGSLFGATGSANFLSRSTAVCAAIFFACTLALAFSAGKGRSAPDDTVLDRPAAASGAASSAVPLTGREVPTGAPAVPAEAPASAVAPALVESQSSGSVSSDAPAPAPAASGPESGK